MGIGVRGGGWEGTVGTHPMVVSTHNITTARPELDVPLHHPHVRVAAAGAQGGETGTGWAGRTRLPALSQWK